MHCVVTEGDCPETFQASVQRVDSKVEGLEFLFGGDRAEISWKKKKPLGHRQKAPLKYSAEKSQGSNGGNYLRAEKIHPPPAHNHEKPSRGYLFPNNPVPPPQGGMSVFSVVKEGAWLRLIFDCGHELPNPVDL